MGEWNGKSGIGTTGTRTKTIGGSGMTFVKTEDGAWFHRDHIMSIVPKRSGAGKLAGSPWVGLFITGNMVKYKTCSNMDECKEECRKLAESF